MPTGDVRHVIVQSAPLGMKVVLLLIAMLLATTQASVRSTHHGGEMFACETVADHLDRGSHHQRLLIARELKRKT